KPESGRSRGLALVPYGLATEMPGRFGDYGEVLLIGVGVADRLTTHERAITYEVRQHDDLVFRPLPHPLRLGDVARNRDPVPGFQGLQGLPTVKGEEGMVTGGGDLPPGLQPQTGNLFDPAGEAMAHGAGNQPKALVQRPHRNISRTGLVEVTRCRLRP